jgi:flagellar biosynthesis regulator FlaF
MSDKKTKVISFIDKRLEKLKKEYMESDDIKKRIDSLISSERAMERLLEDLNVNEENRERIRELRRKIKYED